MFSFLIHDVFYFTFLVYCAGQYFQHYVEQVVEVSIFALSLILISDRPFITKYVSYRIFLQIFLIKLYVQSYLQCSLPCHTCGVCSDSLCFITQFGDLYFVLLWLVLLCLSILLIFLKYQLSFINFLYCFIFYFIDFCSSLYILTSCCFDFILHFICLVLEMGAYIIGLRLFFYV